MGPPECDTKNCFRKKEPIKLYFLKLWSIISHIFLLFYVHSAGLVANNYIERWPNGEYSVLRPNPSYTFTYLYPFTHTHTHTHTHTTGVNPGGGGMGDVYPPTFLGGGWPVQTSPPPPLFEDKITLYLTFIVKKLTFLTVKLLKTPEIARSLRSLAHKCILRLDLCGFASTCIYSFLDIIYVEKV